MMTSKRVHVTRKLACSEIGLAPVLCLLQRARLVRIARRLRARFA